MRNIGSESERVALVTLTLGRRYEEAWRRHCEPGWRAYADRHGYKVVQLTEPLDGSARASARSPAWQKCLVLEQPVAREFDRVVWIDADVAINPSAPPIAAGVPVELVGAVDEYSTPTPELHRRTLEKLYPHWRATGIDFVDNPTARDYYAAWNLPADFDRVVQTGVMVLSPTHHSELLRRTYDRYEDRGAMLNYEMRPLSWELLDAGVVHWLEPRFNYIWGAYKALNFPFLLNDPAHPESPRAATLALADVNFLHFAGNVDEIALLEGSSERPVAPNAAPAVDRRPDRDRRKPLRSPVAMAVFARPDLTAQVLDAVRRARPSRLLVFADAHRPEVPGEKELCTRTRALFDEVGWDCELELEFADRHLGVRERMGSGLDWVFERAEEAIVLEDDCLPDPSFFAFCDELLERYRDDERVLSISGNDFRFRPGGEPGSSYVFSRYPLIWGWATWRRAWSRYDGGIERWPELRESGWLSKELDDPIAVTYWTHQFDRVREGLDTWDYGWLLAGWLTDGLCALPTRNLVSNLGFRPDATHTVDAVDHRSPFAAMPTDPMRFPLRHPEFVTRDAENDRFLEDVVFSGNLSRMLARVRSAHAAREKVPR